MYKTYTSDLYNDIKNYKNNQSIKSRYFKKRIKLFKKKDTIFVNSNIKYIFRNCSVKEWMILSDKITTILKKDDFKINPKNIVSSLIRSYLHPHYKYLLSSYYHYSSKRVSKIQNKYMDISFLIRSLILNNDQDEDHLKFLKNKLKRIGISNYKFVFENNIKKIENIKQLNKENLSDNTKDILKHYFNVNKRKRNFKTYKVRRDYIYDAFLLFFLDLNKYELSNVLFYKKNLNYFDYDYEIFVIKKKSS